MIQDQDVIQNFSSLPNARCSTEQARERETRERERPPEKDRLSLFIITSPDHETSLRPAPPSHPVGAYVVN
jgi:hypothetical protein